MSQSATATLPAPSWVLWTAGATWLILLPLSAMLADDTSFAARIAKGAADGFVAVSFGVLVAGLLLDRWQRREQERRHQVWLARTKRAVPAFLGLIRPLLGDLAVATYRPYRELLGAAEQISDEFIRNDALAIGDPRRWEWQDHGGALDTVANQVMHLRGDLTYHFVATGDVLTHRHHGEPAPSDDRLAELLDDADVQEFLDACLASAAEVSGVATTVGELLKEFRSDFLEEFGLRFDNVEKIGETVQSIGTANRELQLEALDLDRRIRFREADDTRTQEHVDYQRAKWAAEMAGPFDSPIHRAVRLVTGLRRLETTGPHGVR